MCFNINILFHKALPSLVSSFRLNTNFVLDPL